MRVLRRTRSLCPECLRVIDAQYVSGDDAVYLEKSCPEHGIFRVPAWVEHGAPQRFATWQNKTPPTYPQAPSTTSEKGCPFDCGLCPEHAQQTCCALLEVTRRCNMACPVCYASAGGASYDPSLTDVADMLATLSACGGRANVQLSGGEPTVRDDLPDIIRLAHDRGFPFVQLNTNGLRLAHEAGYAERLHEAGLDLVYLQWDGVRESTFTALRGAPCLADKERAAKNCIDAGLSVLLVATVVRGVNDSELGDLLHKALSFGSHVRGLHLQPVASFGRYPWHGGKSPRLTLPELMQALERQSGGMVRAGDFRPPNSEHALCSFSAVYQRRGENKLAPIASEQGCCCSPHAEASQARDFVANHWGRLLDFAAKPQNRMDSFDAFLAASSLRQRFTLSAMAFQDVYNLDLERVRRCHIHIVTQDKRLMPFCMYNMTSIAGVPLYRKD
ncbi:MAG: radical SAM protein [Desulfobulbus sp.]|nr:radical SAM protein [Desulfobulbus sp.]